MNKRTKKRSEYVITVRPEYNCREDEAIRGIRWLLKRLLRQYGLRCIGLDRKDDAVQVVGDCMLVTDSAGRKRYLIGYLDDGTVFWERAKEYDEWT
jgi:hypothetical protein